MYKHKKIIHMDAAEEQLEELFETEGEVLVMPKPLTSDQREFMKGWSQTFENHCHPNLTQRTEHEKKVIVNKTKAKR